MTAAIYLRVSTDDQVGNNSLTTQQQACEAYAHAKHMTVIAVLTDDETGKHVDRPGLNELRRLVREQLVTDVVMYSVDRFHRNLANQIVTRKEFRDAGVAIHYARRGELKDTPEDTLFDNIDATFAEYEREKIRERTMRGTIGKTQGNRVLGAGRPPYGYTYIGERRNRQLIIEPVQAEIVREIFTRYLAGDGVTVITRDLSARQVPTWSDIHGNANRQRRQRTPNTWNEATLYDMLRDELYAGKWMHFRNRKRTIAWSRRHNPGDWIGVDVVPIIDRGIWDQVQTKLSQGTLIGKRNIRNVYALRSLIRCGYCGGAMVGMTQFRPNTSQSYYRCNHRAKRAVEYCSESGYVRADRADAAIWALIQSLLDPSVYAADQAERERLRQTQSAEAANNAHHLERQLHETQRQIDKQLELYQRDIIDLATVERTVKPLRAAAENVQRQLAQLVEPTTPPATIDIPAIIAAMRNALQSLDADRERQREFFLRLDVKVTAVRSGDKHMQLTMTSVLNVRPLTVVV